MHKDTKVLSGRERELMFPERLMQARVPAVSFHHRKNLWYECCYIHDR